MDKKVAKLFLNKEFIRWLKENGAYAQYYFALNRSQRAKRFAHERLHIDKSELLMYAFNWSKTPQKDGFWPMLYRSFKEYCGKQ